MMKIGSVIGGFGVVFLVLSSVGGGEQGLFNLGMGLLALGGLLLLVGFFRGESRNDRQNKNK